MGNTFLTYEGGTLHVDDTWSPLLMKGADNFETEKVRFIKEHIRPGHTFIDVGACEGFYTFLAARFVGDSGTVVAIEPEDSNRHKLRMSITSNAYNNVRVLPYAIDSFGLTVMNLHLSQQVGRHTLIDTGPIREVVPSLQQVWVKSLDDAMKEIDIDESVGGIKIDV